MQLQFFFFFFLKKAKFASETDEKFSLNLYVLYGQFFRAPWRVRDAPGILPDVKCVEIARLCYKTHKKPEF